MTDEPVPPEGDEEWVDGEELPGGEEEDDEDLPDDDDDMPMLVGRKR
jgi:hypothetical protein